MGESNILARVSLGELTTFVKLVRRLVTVLDVPDLVVLFGVATVLDPPVSTLSPAVSGDGSITGVCGTENFVGGVEVWGKMLPGRMSNGAIRLLLLVKAEVLVNAGGTVSVFGEVVVTLLIMDVIG